MYRNIVVGFDGFEESKDALALARRLRAEDGTVTATAVYFGPTAARHHGSSSLLAWVAEGTAKEARAVAGDVDWLRTETVPATSAARGLQTVAEDLSADLVVVGSSHRGRVGRTLAGTVGLRLLNGSPCPVAVAPRGYAGVGDALTRIGMAFDGSAESGEALREAEVLAAACGGTVDPICVVAPIEIWTGELGWYGDFRDEEVDEYRELELKRLMEDAEVQLPDALRERLRLLDGWPGEALVAETRNLDLLVMGSRAYGPLRRVLLGSTAGAVIRDAAAPVLVVPRGAQKRSGRPTANAAASANA